MTRPRRILPGSTYLITKKCMLDRFAIRPAGMVNHILLYCLLVAARKTGVVIHEFCFMSNHYHLLVTDPRARLPVFMRYLNTHASKAINTHRDRVGAVFSHEKYVATEIFDLDTAIDKAVYIRANPVSAGLVSTPEDWPGVTSASYPTGEVITCPRPLIYFGDAFPERVECRLGTLSGLFMERGRAEHIAARIEGRLSGRVEAVRRQMKAKRKRFRGRRRVCRTSWRSSPAKPRKRSELRPCIACKNTHLRIAEIHRLQEFWREYEEARRRFVRGERNVCFPPGTYGLRVNYRVRCRPVLAA